MEYEFCDCCTPSEIAFEFLKASKKSKPFHGYNPNKHSKKGGLNAKGRAAAKRKQALTLNHQLQLNHLNLNPVLKKPKEENHSVLVWVV